MGPGRGDRYAARATRRRHHGRTAFVQALSQRRLIDEYRIVIRAVAPGGGLPLFKDLAAPLLLTLTSAATYADGTAIHVYRPTP
jgi:dihydrofolate reductase